MLDGSLCCTNFILETKASKSLLKISHTSYLLAQYWVKNEEKWEKFKK